MKKRGISLIVLVITIIVMIILATTIILALTGNDVTGKAKEGQLKSDIATMKERLSYTLSEEFLMSSKDEVIELSKEQKESIIPEKYRNMFDIDEKGNLGFIGDPFSWQAEVAENSKVKVYNKMAIEMKDKLDELMGLAKEYISSGKSTKSANQLALQYIRRNRYNSTLWASFAGIIDTNFVSYVDTNKTQSLDLADFRDPVTGYDVDFVHSMAALNVYLEGEKNYIDDYACWFGDLVTVTKEIHSYGTENDLTKDELRVYSLEMIGATEKTSTFSIHDMLADIDACNMSKLCKTGDDLADVIIKYYFTDYSDICKNRYTNFKAFLEERYDLFVGKNSDTNKIFWLTYDYFCGNDANRMLTNVLLDGYKIPIQFFDIVCEHFAEYVENHLE